MKQPLASQLPAASIAPLRRGFGLASTGFWTGPDVVVGVVGMEAERPERMVNISMAEDPKLRTGVRADRSPVRPDSTCVSLSSPRFPIWEGQCRYVMIVDVGALMSLELGRLYTISNFASACLGFLGGSSPSVSIYGAQTLRILCLVPWAWTRSEIFVLFREAAAASLSLVIGFFFPLHAQLERNAKNPHPAQSQGLRNNFTAARAAESPERD